MAFEFFHCKDKLENTLVKALSKSLQFYITKQDSVVLALSGGKSPIKLFEALSKEDIQWQKVFISLVDERITSLSSDESNTKLIFDYLLQNKAHKAHFIPLLEDETKDIKEQVGFANSCYKQADIVLLGMGLDGHFASLFPNCDELDEALITHENIVFTQPKNAPYARLSMSLSAILKSKALFLSIKGKEKKEIFDKASVKDDKNLPISLILNSKEVVCNVYYGE